MFLHDVYLRDFFDRHQNQTCHAAAHTSTAEAAAPGMEARPLLLVLYRRLCRAATDENPIREVHEAGYTGRLVSAADLGVHRTPHEPSLADGTSPEQVAVWGARVTRLPGIRAPESLGRVTGRLGRAPWDHAVMGLTGVRGWYGRVWCCPPAHGIRSRPMGPGPGR